MKFGSVCSGIEAASVAWEPLGWRSQFFSEIDAFPCALLAHRYPTTPNFGDMTKFKEWPDAALDLLCGGTPCQSFSAAGLRAGLDDPRGQLMLTFGAIAARYRPRWLVWENVPGVLSSRGGRDFGAFLGLLGFLGYGFAYRVLDAQFVRVDGYPRAVPQRRRRVFVVGCLGDWRSAAAVLLERESLRGDPAPRRSTWAGVAVAPTLRAGGNRTGGDRPPGTDVDTMETLQVAYSRNNSTGPVSVSTALTGHPGGRYDYDSETFVAHTMRAEGFDASEDGTGRGTPLVPVPLAGHAPAIAFDARQSNVIQYGDKAGPLDTCGYTMGVQQAAAVRRLTPVECERLMGFPDHYTAIPYRGKPAADGPRYKALGNSWAVNCARWIGQRIEMVEGIRT